jgi:hypothetical protein
MFSDDIFILIWNFTDHSGKKLILRLNKKYNDQFQKFYHDKNYDIGYIETNYNIRNSIIEYVFEQINVSSGYIYSISRDLTFTRARITYEDLFGANVQLDTQPGKECIALFENMNQLNVWHLNLISDNFYLDCNWWHHIYKYVPKSVTHLTVTLRNKYPQLYVFKIFANICSPHITTLEFIGNLDIHFREKYLCNSALTSVVNSVELHEIILDRYESVLLPDNVNIKKLILPKEYDGIVNDLPLSIKILYTGHKTHVSDSIKKRIDVKYF